jgi:hypothetical protein
MITVSVAKRIGLTPSLQRTFEDVSEAARFVESWLPMHVTIHDETGQPLDAYGFLRCHREPKETQAELYAGDAGDLDPPGAPTGDPCPFCGAPESPILADDECLHACALCDRHWYVDHQGNVLPADRCPICESDSITIFEDGRRLCSACGHGFFFDGLTYVDPKTVETEGDEC